MNLQDGIKKRLNMRVNADVYYVEWMVNDDDDDDIFLLSMLMFMFFFFFSFYVNDCRTLLTRF